MIVAEWTVDRGRSYELDKNAPGTATVKIIDTTGEADPTTGLYDFRPGTPSAIALHNPVTDTDHEVFVGHITRYSYDVYQSNEYAVGTIEMVDALEHLARTEMYPGQFGDVSFADVQAGDVLFLDDDQVADRVNRILDDAGFPVGAREIFSGNVLVQKTVYAHRTPALTAILDAVDAEFPGVANFYIQKDGRATFHGRLARFNPAHVDYHIRTWNVADLRAYEADDAIIFELGYEEDLNKVINSALVTPKGIRNVDVENQRVEDVDSVATYGTRSISFENLICAGDHFDGANARDAVKKIGTYYVSNYSEPRIRVNRITFKRVEPDSTYAEALWELLCNVDISDIIRLETDHFDGFGFQDEDHYVEGLHYRARPWRSDALDVELTLDLSPAAYFETNPWS